ncbi:hypothetical protein [Sinomonas gamaensis]|uniref:hypothetical protein n=1 Tax=Sinomonas gamaensis TaxID=2565624 RepID=UPI001108B494|nr:hypothetical protein [Sinomonas gamaensis]
MSVDDGGEMRERLRHAAVSGTVFDLAPEVDEDDFDLPRAEEAGLLGELSAEDIRALLLERDFVPDPRGLRIRGAIVTGCLDLDHAKPTGRIVFSFCRFEEAPSFEQAVVPELVLEGVFLPGLSLRSARLTGYCKLTELHSTGPVVAENSQIGSGLDMSGARLCSPGGTALNLDGAHIGGDTALEGLKAWGEVRGLGARIGGQLVLTNGSLDHKGGWALGLDWAEIASGLFMDGLVAAGEVRAPGAKVGGQLILTGAHLCNQKGYALNLDGADIVGGVFMSDVNATGEVRAIGARIGAPLNMHHAVLTASLTTHSAEAFALNLDRADIAGGVNMRGVRVTGEVRALGASIGSQINLTRAQLHNKGGDALSLDGARITGAVMHRLRTQGKVRCIGTHIDGEFRLTRASLHASGNGHALDLNGAQIADSLLMDRIRVRGEVGAINVRIGGQLSLTDRAKLKNPGGHALNLDGAEISGGAFMQELVTEGEVRALDAHISDELSLTHATLSNGDKCALNLDRVEVTGAVFLDDIEATGEVRFAGSRIHGRLNLFKAKFSNTSGDALKLTAATLDELLLDGATATGSTIDLSFVTARILAVGARPPDEGLPRLSAAHGWTLGTVHGFLRTDRKSARAWLDTVDTRPANGNKREFPPQPWKELAKVYDQVGQPADARWLRHCAAKRTTRAAPPISRLIRWAYGVLVGYGYYPRRAAYLLAALWVTVFLLASANAPAFTPADARASTVAVTENNRTDEIHVTGATAAPPDYPQFSPGLFAVDTAIPAAATGQSNAWRVTGNALLLAAFAAIKGFAWLLTVLMLAGLTGILRKD